MERSFTGATGGGSSVICSRTMMMCAGMDPVRADLNGTKEEVFLKIDASSRMRRFLSSKKLGLRPTTYQDNAKTGFQGCPLSIGGSGAGP